MMVRITLSHIIILFQNIFDAMLCVLILSQSANLKCFKDFLFLFEEMGRTKTNSGGGGSSQSPLMSENSTSTAAAETRIKDLLKELYELIHQIQVHGTHIVTVVTNRP